VQLIDPQMLTFENEELQRQREETLRKQAAARKLEEDRRLREAELLIDAGDEEAANALLDAPVELATFVGEPEQPKVSGLCTRTLWSGEVYDKVALAAHVVAHPEDADLIDGNVANINSRARSQKDKLSIPGVRPVSKQVKAGAAE
jgi:hypothetical protein